jgi:ferredoxin
MLTFNAMADITRKVPQNVPGRFFVDNTCIFCDLCTQISPNNFREDNYHGWAFVVKQPETVDEFGLCIEARDACPTESIGLTR